MFSKLCTSFQSTLLINEYFPAELYIYKHNLYVYDLIYIFFIKKKQWNPCYRNWMCIVYSLVETIFILCFTCLYIKISAYSLCIILQQIILWILPLAIFCITIIMIHQVNIYYKSRTNKFSGFFDFNKFLDIPMDFQ